MRVRDSRLPSLTGRLPPLRRVREPPGNEASGLNLAAQLRRRQRGQFLPVAVARRGSGEHRRGRGMGVDFADAIRQIRDEPREPRLGHRSAPGEPEDLIGRGQADVPETQALKPRPGADRSRRQTGASAFDSL